MSGDLTIGHVDAHREQLLEALNGRAGVVRDFVRGVARSYYTGFYLYGPPGTAKTHTVRGVLEEELRTPYVYRRGHLTPVGLFQLLASHADDVIVMDDVGSIFAQPVALQIMLAALEQPKKGRTRRITYKRKDHEESFDFRGGLVAISNLQLHDAGLLEAVKSRVHTFRYDPPPAQLAALMLDIAARGHPPGGVSAADATGVARHVIGEVLRLRSRMDLRLLVDKALPLFVQARDDEAETHWKDLVTASIEESLSETRHEVEPPESRRARVEAETTLAIEIYHALPTHEARVEAWTAKTGKSRRAFYRRLEKAQEGRQ